MVDDQRRADGISARRDVASGEPALTTDAWMEQAAWVVPATTVHTLSLRDRRWRVTVATTGAPDAPAPERAVYVLDPFGTLGLTLHAARTLHLLGAGQFPPLTVVGVGPDSDDPAELFARRVFDLTLDPPPGTPPAEQSRYGGGRAFLDLLCGQIIPHIEARHHLDPDGRTLAGWSLGGLLAAYALLDRSSVFPRTLLVSPSLYMDTTLEHLLPASTLLTTTHPVETYLACGAAEQADAALSWPRPQDPASAQHGVDTALMITNVERFAERLRTTRRPALEVTTDVLAGEHHSTLWPAAVTRGLLTLHGTTYEIASPTVGQAREP